MNPRPRFLPTVLAALALLLGATIAAGLTPAPLPIGAVAGSADVSPSSADAGPSGNDTNPPVNDTRPPGNETGPPGNETRPPLNDTRDPLPAPQVTPENQSLRGSYGASLAFGVTVTNPAKDAQRINVTLTAPLGWTARLDAYDPQLGAKDSVAITGTVHASIPGRGVVRIHVQGHDAGTDAYLDVCFDGLVFACPSTGDNSTGGNASNPKNGTKPPKNETQPPGNETQPPQNDTAEAPGVMQASAPGQPLVERTVDEPAAPARADAAIRVHPTLSPMPAGAPSGEVAVHVA